MKNRILVLDNPKWIARHTDELVDSGDIFVLPATTLEEAASLYREWQHQIGAIIVDESLFNVSFVEEAKETVRIIVATSDDEHRRQQMVAAGCTDEAAKDEAALCALDLLATPPGY